MKLESVSLRNFRGHVETTVAIDELTVLVGRNDAGKSSILDALAIFFSVKGAKIDSSDLNKFTIANIIEIRCTFSDTPNTIVIDDSAPTNLADEFLLNTNAHLEIIKRWKFGGKTQHEVLAHAIHPTADGISNLLEVKLAELKTRAEAKGVTVADKRKSPLLRKALFDAVADKKLEARDIPLSGDGDGKKIWDKLEAELPLYCLFKADRSTSDEDSEAQDPMTLAVRQALKEVEADLTKVSAHVRARVQEVAQRTVAELRRIDTNLAAELNPDFKADPKWDALFKLSLTGDKEIPLNKRGSGVRRLVLLAFLIAEIDRRREQEARARVIYAIEEPETALHPTQQAILVDTLRRLSETGTSQVILTTHAPSLAALLPHRDLRLVLKDGDESTARVDSGEDTPNRIATELGILPHADRQKVRVVVCVEGPTDAAFLVRATDLLRAKDVTLPDFSGSDERILLLPLGGGTLRHWVENRYLRNLGVPEVHVYDRDVGQPPKYQAQVDTVNARTDGSAAFLTNKRELDNYYPTDAILACADVSVTFTDESDVAMVVAEPAYEKRNPGKTWAEAPNKLRQNCADRIKAQLASGILQHLTADQLVGTGYLAELQNWMAPVIARLTK